MKTRLAKDGSDFLTKGACVQHSSKQIALALLFFLLLFFEVADNSHGINNNYLQVGSRSGLALVNKSGAAKPIHLTSEYMQYYLLPVYYSVFNANVLQYNYNRVFPAVKSKRYLHLLALLI